MRTRRTARNRRDREHVEKYFSKDNRDLSQIVREKRPPRCMYSNKNNEVNIFKFQKTDNFDQRKRKQ